MLSIKSPKLTAEGYASRSVAPSPTCTNFLYPCVARSLSMTRDFPPDLLVGTSLSNPANSPEKQQQQCTKLGVSQMTSSDVNRIFFLCGAHRRNKTPVDSHGCFLWEHPIVRPLVRLYFEIRPKSSELPRFCLATSPPALCNNVHFSLGEKLKSPAVHIFQSPPWNLLCIFAMVWKSHCGILLLVARWKQRRWLLHFCVCPEGHFASVLECKLPVWWKFEGVDLTVWDWMRLLLFSPLKTVTSSHLLCERLLKSNYLIPFVSCGGFSAMNRVMCCREGCRISRRLPSDAWKVIPPDMASFVL